MRNKWPIVFVVLAVLWIIFVGIYVETSYGEEVSKKDWVDIVGEHIGGWEQPFTIDVSVMRGGKAHIRVMKPDETCYEYFVPQVKESLVLHRNCGEKEWHKLN